MGQGVSKERILWKGATLLGAVPGGLMLRCCSVLGFHRCVHPYKAQLWLGQREELRLFSENKLLLAIDKKHREHLKYFKNSIVVIHDPTELDDDVIAQIIKQVDENGDGEISYEEFAQMMLKNIE